MPLFPPHRNTEHLDATQDVVLTSRDAGQLEKLTLLPEGGLLFFVDVVGHFD
jgi:hypothetical protein